MARLGKSMSAARGALLLIGIAGAVVAATSCDDRSDFGRRCDFGSYNDAQGQRCRTVCDYWCDDFGCYPECWDQCWDDCGGAPTMTPIAADAAAGDASVGAVGTGTITANDDASSKTGGDASGVLCSSCIANDDCESGALCILRGGSSAPTPTDASAADGGAPATTTAGFCGHLCVAAIDCPSGFTCTQIGSTKECLPNGGSCP